MRGAISDGLSTARLPAASTLASGDSKVYSGAFQVPMMPTTPFGWYCTQAVAPKASNGAKLGRGSGAIHAARWSRACLSEASEPRMSFIIENTAGPAAEVFVHRRAQRVVMLDQQVDDALQALAAHGGRDRALGREGGALCIEQCAD